MKSAQQIVIVKQKKKRNRNAKAKGITLSPANIRKINAIMPYAKQATNLSRGAATKRKYLDETRMDFTTNIVKTRPQEIIDCVFQTDQSEGVRWTDPYTMIPTAVCRTQQTVNPQVYNGTTGADGSLAFIYTGSGYQTAQYNMAISAAHAITWAAASPTNQGYTATGVWTRPVGFTLIIEFSFSGDPHSVQVNWVPISPMNLSSACALSFLPTATNTGIDSAQRNLGGRTADFSSNESCALVALPIDSMSLDFMSSVTARESNGWMGGAVWIYGLKSTDTVKVHTHFAEEWFHTAPSASTYNSVELKAAEPSPTVAAKAMVAIERHVNKGHNFLKFIKGVGRFVGKVIDVAEKVIPIVGPLFAMRQMAYAVRYNPTVWMKRPDLRTATENSRASSSMANEEFLDVLAEKREKRRL